MDRAMTFEEFKYRLATAPILPFLDVSRNHGTFILTSDASDVAMGVVLSHGRSVSLTIGTTTQSRKYRFLKALTK